MTRPCSPRTIALALLALLLCTSSAGAKEPLHATIVERGIYKLDTGERRRQPSGVMTTKVSNICHVASTTRIPARLNLWFGFRYRIDGTAEGGVAMLRLLTHFPTAAQPPGAPKPIASYERSVAILVGTVSFTGYGFDEAWEFMPGTWIFSLFDGGRKLAEQRFTIVIDDSAPEPSGDGRLDCFVMTGLPYGVFQAGPSVLGPAVPVRRS